MVGSFIKHFNSPSSLAPNKYKREDTYLDNVNIHNNRLPLYDWFSDNTVLILQDSMLSQYGTGLSYSGIGS